MLPPAKLRWLTRGRHIFHESLDPYKQDGPKKTSTKTNSTYIGELTPGETHVDTAILLGFPYNFIIYTDRPGRAHGVDGFRRKSFQSRQRFDGPSRSGWTVKTNEEKQCKKS